jgi:hypothetical protein
VGKIAHLASMSKGGTGFQPVACGSHSQDGCATLRTQGSGKRGSLTAQARAVMGGILPALPSLNSRAGSRRDACPPLVSTGGVRLSQRSPLGDFQRRFSFQTERHSWVSPLGAFPCSGEPRYALEKSFSLGLPLV